MNAQAIDFYAKKFFPHLLPDYGRLSIQSVLKTPAPKPLISAEEAARSISDWYGKNILVIAD